METIEILHDICKEAGKIIISTRMDFHITEKSKGEIVTTADKRANAFIINKVTKHFPHAWYYSEEQGIEGKQNEIRFIIDPLDGTTRKVWGQSGYTIAIAEEVHGIIQRGVVYDPEHDEFFYAIKGKGAFRNEERIRVSDLTKLDKALVSCDWGNNDQKRCDGLQYYQKLMLPDMKAQRIVPQFSPANDLVRIAEGRIHALICNDTWEEDHAAGALILKEAGGYITNFDRRDSFDHHTPGIIATNNKIVWEALTDALFATS